MFYRRLHRMPGGSRLALGLPALAAACSLLVVSSTAHAARRERAEAARQQVAFPDLREARRLVAYLWEEHNDVLKLSELDGFEWGGVKSLDSAYVTGVWCGCESARPAGYAARVIPQIPRSSVQGAFLAQVRETDAATHKSTWHVVVVAWIAGHWKLTFVAHAGSGMAPPLRELGRASAATGAVTAGTTTRISHLAAASVHYVMTHYKLTSRTSYGITVHSRAAVRPKVDGIYGLALPKGRVLACFTLHAIDTYSAPSGLRQGSLRRQWSHLLAPGVYRSITADTARPMCVEGSGVGAAVGAFRAGDEQRIVAVHGTRL